MKLDVNEANNIPILEVAQIVVPRFTNKGSRSTGECQMHTDRNLGNLRFKIEANFAHCFTCNNTWWPVSLVIDFLNLSFQEALEFLYERFPSYFTIVEEYEKKPKWNGLSNKDYKFLGISIQQHFGSTMMDIRDFARSFPDEHDKLLITKILEKQKEIDRLYIFLSNKMDEVRLKKDRKEMEDKIYRMLAKGLMNKKNKQYISKNSLS